MRQKETKKRYDNKVYDLINNEKIPNYYFCSLFGWKSF